VPRETCTVCGVGVASDRFPASTANRNFYRALMSKCAGLRKMLLCLAVAPK